ncbi:MAG: FadR family transcriptional regulator [Bacteroidetes bacterium]|nr:FadR family transcriptional regulator [Bacteroidota bacterium]
MKIQQVKQKTVTFQVMEQLKELIASGTLKPNDKMPNEYELAEMFGVGRSTIREVLKIFQYIGVIELRNPKGTFICESSNISSEALEWSMLLGHKDFTEIIELRIIMEQQGLWYLMEFRKNDTNLKKVTMDHLRQDIRDMEAAIADNSDEKRLAADYNFHGHIIQACNNAIFHNLYNTMKQFMVKEIQDSQMDTPYLSSVIKRHKKLLDLIEEGDYLKTSDQFRHHIRNIDVLLDEKMNNIEESGD